MSSWKILDASGLQGGKERKQVHSVFRIQNDFEPNWDFVGPGLAAKTVVSRTDYKDPLNF